jgi:hypothetical protein
MNFPIEYPTVNIMRRMRIAKKSGIKSALKNKRGLLFRRFYLKLLQEEQITMRNRSSIGK